MKFKRLKIKTATNILILALFGIFILFKSLYKPKVNIDKPSSSDISYKVTAVADGDTLNVKTKNGKERVRLIGIDAPETKKQDKKAECYANKSYEFLKNLTLHKQVILKKDPFGEDKDIYDRLLRYVFLADGTNLNAEIIKQGFAPLYYKNNTHAYASDFKAYEKQAKKNKIGLWGKCDN